MPSMPGHVAKTQTFTRMDRSWQGHERDYMLSYDTGASVDALLDQAVAAGVISAATATHVRDHWLNLYWPTADAREVLQRGLYWGMRVSLFAKGETPRPKPLPISCAWVCMGPPPVNKKPRFEVVVLESEQQVTLLFITPEPAHPMLVPKPGAFQPIWSVRRKELGIEHGEEQVDCWRNTLTVRPYDFPEL